MPVSVGGDPSTSFAEASHSEAITGDPAARGDEAIPEGIEAEAEETVEVRRQRQPEEPSA